MSDITQWDAWQRGLAAAKAAMAEAELKINPPDVRATSRWKPSTEPIAYCLVTNCGLTVAPGDDRCWTHKAVEAFRKEGLL